MGRAAICGDLRFERFDFGTKDEALRVANLINRRADLVADLIVDTMQVKQWESRMYLSFIRHVMAQLIPTHLRGRWWLS